ncbi:MAG: alanyl-tRNA editing protein [Clostridiales bacterium]|nr:alanyl-tRNA editing protein [Clostridiales bacterium]
MSVKKIFWDDPYKTSLTTTVTGVKEARVTLSETIFYAFSGGQQPDKGSIGGFAVLQAQKDGTEIYYTLPDHHTLSAGDTVEILIDWNRRYRLMKLHFAAELVLETMYQKFDRPEKTGANITPQKARVDFRWEGPVSSVFPKLLPDIQSIIAADLPIISGFENEREELRYWEIKGFAKVLCGGTHLKRTGEIGVVQLRRKNNGKGLERIEITLAE